MSPTAMRSNPFMLLLNPEVVVAAMEKSERLSQLNRHLCRPLDKILPGMGAGEDTTREDDEPEGLAIQVR